MDRLGYGPGTHPFDSPASRFGILRVAGNADAGLAQPETATRAIAFLKVGLGHSVSLLGAHQKISDFPKLSLTPPPNHQYIPPHPVPQRGVSGSSETRGGMWCRRQRQA